MAWWLWQTRSWDAEGWLAVTGTYTAGTVLAQWGLALGLLLVANRWLATRLSGDPAPEVSR
jgi:hypothetical protein